MSDAFRRLSARLVLIAVVAVLSAGCRSVDPAASPGNPVRTGASRPVAVEASSADGFHWPYLLYTPRELRDGTRPLLLLALNTPEPTDDYREHWDQAIRKVDQYRPIADNLGLPLLVAALPRFLHRMPVGPGDADGALPEVEGYEPVWVIGTQSLNRNSLLTDNRFLARPDLQVLAMARDARGRLAARGVRTSSGIVPIGFSSSGTFAIRLALLHPERVIAVAAGAPGGWYPLPVDSFAGAALRYPLGTADRERFVSEDSAGDAGDGGARSARIRARQDEVRYSLSRVPVFVFAGADDTDDSVPYLDAYAYEDRVTIEHLFGRDPIRRYEGSAEVWGGARRMHADNAPFILRLYPDTGHDFTDGMKSDVIAFIEAQVRLRDHPGRD